MSMTRFGRVTLSYLLLSSLVGCAGQITATDEPDGGPDDTPDAAVVEGADAGPLGPMYRVTGVTKDYSSGDPLPSIALATEGIVPAMQTMSAMDGAYTLEQVPASTSFYFRAMPMGVTYVPTTNPGITVLDADVQTDVRVVSTIYAQRQHTSVGITRDPLKSLVVADLRNLDGTPFEGVPLDGISLVPEGMTTPILVDKYFIGATGDVDPALLVSTSYPSLEGMGAAKARVAFLNVPTGSFTIQVTFTPIGGTLPISATGSATTYDGGATVTRVIHDPGADAGAVPTFTADIYPILMKASQGGQDCASCHTLGGTAGNVLVLDDGAPLVHARLIASPLLVNLITPADSLLLTKPLFETPPNHPNAIWLDITDPYYMKIMAWIVGGAPL